MLISAEIIQISYDLVLHGSECSEMAYNSVNTTDLAQCTDDVGHSRVTDAGKQKTEQSSLNSIKLMTNVQPMK